MAASMSLQQPSRTHLFRSHISYPDDIYSTAPPSKRRDDRPAQGSPRSRRDDGLRSHRQYPVQQQGSDDRDRNAGSDYIDHDRQQARADRPLPLHPAHAVPRQLGPPPSRAYEESRVQVSNLITTPTSSTGPMLPRGSPTNRSSSPADALSNSGHLPRLPSVDQLLAGHASDATERERPEPSGAPQFVEPQYHRANQDLPGLTTNHGRPAGHSAGSSLSSMYSEPTSPRSYNGHSYSSPSPHQRYAPAHHDVRGQAPSYLRHDQYPPPQRDDMAQVYHQRSQPNIYPSTGGHPPPAAYTPYVPPIQAPYAPQHQAPYQTQYQTPYRTPHPRSSMDLYGQMPRPDPPAQRPLPDYAPPGPNAYPQGSSGHLSDLRNDSVMGSAYPVYNYPSHSYPPPRKRRGNLPKDATKIMKEWFAAHKDSPYPSEEQKQMLVSQTRLCMNQVNNWFINARRRQPRKEAESIFERERERGVTENSEDSLGNEVANEHDWPRQRMPQTHNHGPPPAPLPFQSRQEHPSNREQEEDERNLRSNRRPGPSPPPGPPHT